MKVLYIAKFDEFYKTGNYVADAFNRQSVQVIKVSPEIVFEKIKTIVDNEQPDFVLCGKAMRVNQLIPWLKSRSIHSVFWLYDMAWGSSPVASANLNHILEMNLHESDLFFSTDGGHDEEWATVGVDHLILRQGIHLPDHVWVQKIKINFDILFTGYLYFDRRTKMINFLQQKYGKQFRHIASGLRGRKLSEVIQATKIVIVDSYPSHKYWSNRVYETAGRGGFVLHSATDGLVDEFVNNRDIIIFQHDNQFEHLETTIDRYLEDEQDRERIRINGFNKCPTYDDRVKVMISYIKQLAEQERNE